MNRHGNFPRLPPGNLDTNQKGSRYSTRKVLIATGVVTGALFMLFEALSPTAKGKTEDMVPVAVLSKEENRAVHRYVNDYHLEVAKAKGLAKPLVSKAEHKADAKAFSSRYKLVEITDNKYYEIPHLTNSLAYLQPPAEEFLTLIGERFCDRLGELEMTDYRFSVTSVLRTIEDQKSLRKNNLNATANNSSHYYGRTFDIAQTRFFERGNSTPVYSYRLRNLLLRELIKLQEEGKCYVLLESQTKCIHVTVR
ncbi:MULTISPECIES: DUF5715 family protein [unclassified Imperialibacter]|uniref:DUF5715 family protein n=1 Tax=unclassified Imperialibacter TaxID=2629706 RepID=UPI001254FE90|nr:MULTISPECIES: DUF5715 family protein [unclassified Imperialibacter]CAD5277195.1 conserved hypothetical protein [Imperialibacter sp. 75]CAD5295175.1 conserved hypothetical protein [Imperialibacter sp. 89]VVT12205.1 conserved hypothetical protein [Imperialibacter sp. EC-SDR9]